MAFPYGCCLLSHTQNTSGLRGSRVLMLHYCLQIIFSLLWSPELIPLFPLLMYNGLPPLHTLKISSESSLFFSPFSSSSLGFNYPCGITYSTSGFSIPCSFPHYTPALYAPFLRFTRVWICIASEILATPSPLFHVLTPSAHFVHWALAEPRTDSWLLTIFSPPCHLLSGLDSVTVVRVTPSSHIALLLCAFCLKRCCCFSDWKILRRTF